MTWLEAKQILQLTPSGESRRGGQLGSGGGAGDFQTGTLVVSGFTNGNALVQGRWCRNPAEFVVLITHHSHRGKCVR